MIFPKALLAEDIRITLTNGLLTVTDLTGRDNSLLLSEEGANLVIADGAGAIFSSNVGSLAADGQSVSIPFSEITSGLAIDAGPGDDDVEIATFIDNEMPGLTIHGGPGDDRVFFDGPITFRRNAGASIVLPDEEAATPADSDAIYFGAAFDLTPAFLTFSGTGGLTMKAGEVIYVGPSSGVQTENGSILLEANQQPQGTGGNHPGVYLLKSMVQVSGIGSITVKGAGGDTSYGQHGIKVSGSVITGGTAGSVLLQGQGGPSEGNFNCGVMIEADSVISTQGANINISGQGGGVPTSGLRQEGVVVDNSSVQAGGDGLVTISGTGGEGAGNLNRGVSILSGSIGSMGGAVTLNGTGGGSEASGAAHGVYVEEGGVINVAGAGPLTVIGEAGPGVGVSSHGVLLTGVHTKVSTLAGPLVIQGTEGAGLGSMGIWLEDQAAVQSAGPATLTLACNSLHLETGAAHASVSAPDGIIDLVTHSQDQSTPILLGTSATDARGSLILSPDMLLNLHADALHLGDAGGGPLTIVSSVDLSRYSSVRLGSGAGVFPSATGTDLTAASLSFVPGTPLCFEIAGPLPDTGYTRLTVAGSLDLSGAVLRVSGSYGPSIGQSFALLAVTGSPLLGTFTGLPEGAVIGNLLGGNVTASISYAGNSGSEAALTVLTANTPLQSWRQQHFGSLFSIGNGDDVNDPDHDGLTNLMEFAFGLNPGISGSAPLSMEGTDLLQRGTPLVTASVDGDGPRFHAVFSRRKDRVAAGLVYQPQFSTDLVTWQDATDVPSVLASDGEMEAVSVPYPPDTADQQFRFFRVQVTSAFNTTDYPVLLTKVSGSGQSVTPGAFLDQPLVIRATRHGSPEVGASVLFNVTPTVGGIAATAGGTPQTTLSLTTDGQGLASVFYKAPPGSSAALISASATTGNYVSSVSFAVATDPVAPASFSANRTTPQTIAFHWSDSPNETGYVIEATTDNGATWQTLASPGANETTANAGFHDSAANAGFRIRSVNSVGYSHCVYDAAFGQLDSDNDGLTNQEEANLNPPTDPLNPDTDGDGLRDGDEVKLYAVYGLSPTNAHSKEAGLTDGQWLTQLDNDHDGLPDRWEIVRNLDPTKNDAALDPDNDGLTNYEEYLLGTDPHNPDTDGDGLKDGDEAHVFAQFHLSPINAHTRSASSADAQWLDSLDTDGDGLPDRWEIAHNLDPNDPADAALDQDGDGLTALQEYALGTDPWRKDSDGDGIPDGEDALPMDPFNGLYNWQNPPTVTSAAPSSAAPSSAPSSSLNFFHIYRLGLTTTDGDGSSSLLYEASNIPGVGLVILHPWNGNYNYNPPPLVLLMPFYTTESLTAERRFRFWDDTVDGFTVTGEETSFTLRWGTGADGRPQWTQDPDYNPDFTPTDGSPPPDGSTLTITAFQPGTLASVTPSFPRPAFGSASPYLAPASPDYNDPIASPTDAQLVRLLIQRTSTSTTGLFHLTLPAGVTAYDIQGIPIPAADLDVNLASPTGALASIAYGATQLWVALAPGTAGGQITANLNGLSDSVTLSPVEFKGAHLDDKGRVQIDAQGGLTWDRDCGPNPPKTSVQRLIQYRSWYNRQIDNRAATGDTHYGIKGLLRLEAPELSAASSKNNAALENTYLAPFVNLDTQLFKIRVQDLLACGVQNITVVPVTRSNGQDSDGTPIELPVKAEQEGSTTLITQNSILLYEDNANKISQNQITPLVPANTHIIKAAKIKLKFVTTGQPGNQSQPSEAIEAKRLQVYLASGSTILSEHNPTQPETSTGGVSAGSPVNEPQSDNHRFYFTIDENDTTPDIRLELKNEDGSDAQIGQTATVDWYLLYKFKAGSWNDSHGVKFDVWQWHKLQSDANAAGNLTIRETNELWEDRIPDEQHRFRQGGVQPGDYRLFARVRRDGEIKESNSIAFKIICRNPANAGRVDKELNPARGADGRLRVNPTYTGAYPALFTGFINQFPSPSVNGVQFPEFGNWYKAILCQESEYSGYSWRQSFDNNERVPETGGVDVGFDRSFNNRTWLARFGYPFVSYDNGWGASQQTRTDNTIIRIARWKANFVEGWHELTVVKINEWLPYVQNTLYQGVALADIPVEHVYKSIVKGYNGGRQYIFQNGQVIESANQNINYVPDVQAFKTSLGL